MSIQTSTQNMPRPNLARHTAIRVGWMICVVLSLVVFLFAIPVRYAQFLSPEDEVRLGLTQLGYSEQYIEQYGSETATRDAMKPLGLSSTGYASLSLALEVVVTLTYIAVGFVIAWRKFDDPFGLFASLFLIMFGIGGSSYLLLPLIVKNYAGFIIGGLVTTLAYALMPPFFYTFPDGRWVPRWGWIPAGLWGFTTWFWNFAPRSPLNPTNWPLWIFALDLLFIWGSAFAAQIYRYHKISSPNQRQQTKWLVSGFGLMVFLILIPSILGWIFISSFLTGAFYSLLFPIQVLLFSIIPITLGISILRYRLWDIDILIRRTLQYTILTGLLGLIYFGSVILLQTGFRTLTGQTNSPVITVLSTLGIATLFTPLRNWVQDFIDRRFYRKKYNAEQALAQFAIVARDEVDMDRLTDSLIGVVQETVQPERVSIWLIGEPVDQ